MLRGLGVELRAVPQSACMAVSEVLIGRTGGRERSVALAGRARRAPQVGTPVSLPRVLLGSISGLEHLVAFARWALGVFGKSGLH